MTWALTIGTVLIIAALLMYEPIALWLMVREIRKQAALLPEDRREAYLREALSALEEGMRDA